VTNNGSVDEPHTTVTFTLARQPTGAATTVKRVASVLATRSVGLAPVTFAVKPGNTYQLTVAIAVSPLQTVATGTTLSETLQIAPGT
jgi:hypothetical protein